MDKKVLTVQDISCYGQCSITVALPILSACRSGDGDNAVRYFCQHIQADLADLLRDLTEDLPKIMEHWLKEGISFDAIYTGYLGSKRQIDIVKDLFNNLLKPER